MKYKLKKIKNGNQEHVMVSNDGHTMLMSDVVKELNDNYESTRRSHVDLLIDNVILRNPQIVESIKNGGDKLINFLVGKVMSRLVYNLNPNDIKEILEEKLKVLK